MKKRDCIRNFYSPILLCAQTVFPELSEEELHAHWKDFQKGLSPFQTLFRNFLANELYSDLVLPDYSIKEMLLKLQWIAMEYTAIRQSLFFSWLGHPSLSYERVRQTNSDSDPDDRLRRLKIFSPIWRTASNLPSGTGGILP